MTAGKLRQNGVADTRSLSLASGESLTILVWSVRRGWQRCACPQGRCRFRLEHVCLLEGKVYVRRVDDVYSKMRWDSENRGTDVGKESMMVWDRV